MPRFSASEVFQFAIKIEEDGENFYNEAANNTENEDIKNMFIYLAGQEVEHKEFFSEILSGIEDYKPEDNYPDEYFIYIKAYADKMIFSAEKQRAQISGMNDLKGVLDFAAQRELDTILYYQEIKGIANSSQRGHIDKIIQEERKHFLEISKIKNVLSKQ